MKKKSKDKLPQLSEKMFQSRVVAGARALGYMVYHTYDSRRSTKGFPDLCLVHPKTHVLMFIEVKTDMGKISLEQFEWINALGNCLNPLGSFSTARVLRPAGWDMFWETLKGAAK